MMLWFYFIGSYLSNGSLQEEAFDFLLGCLGLVKFRMFVFKSVLTESVLVHGRVSLEPDSTAFCVSMVI